MSTVIDQNTKTTFQQCATGPVSGPACQFTLPCTGVLHRQRFRVEHTPQPLPDLAVARKVAIAAAVKRAQTGEKTPLPKVRSRSRSAVVCVVGGGVVGSAAATVSAVSFRCVGSQWPWVPGYTMQLGDPHGFTLLEMRISKCERADDHLAGTVSAQYVNAGRIRLGVDLVAEMHKVGCCVVASDKNTTT